jgi:hypothetical protein
MADVVNVSDLIVSARRRANMENTQFVTDAEVITYLDQAYRKFYNLIVTDFENWFVSETSFATVDGTDEYNLPTDFYKLLGVDLVDASGRAFTLRPFELSERNRIVHTWIGKPVRYILKGTNIKLVPVPSGGAQTIKILYVPSPTAITSSAQTLEVFNGFDEYICLDAAIRMLMKEESDTALLERERAYMEQQINDLMRGRDGGFPKRVTDLATLNDRSFFRWWGI